MIWLGRYTSKTKVTPIQVILYLYKYESFNNYWGYEFELKPCYYKKFNRLFD